MNISIRRSSRLDKFDYLLIGFIFSIPLTHKEMFVLWDQDLMISKWLLATLAIIGFYYFIKRYKFFAKDIFYILISSVLFGQLFSLIVSLDKVNTFRLILFQASVTFSYPFIRIYTEKKGFDLIFKAYLYTFYFVFAFLIFQVVLKTGFDKLTGGIWPVPGYPTRYGSTFWDVNHFGAYLSSVFFLFLGIFFHNRKTKQAKLFVAGSVLALIAMTFTDSRSALIGFVSGLTLFGASYFYKRIHHTVKPKTDFVKYMYNNAWGWASLLLTFGTLTFFVLGQDAIRAAFLYRSTSFFSHLYLLKSGISIALDNFSTGIGANAFYAYFKQSEWASAYYYIDRAAQNYKLPLHNLWLEVLVETGLVAFILFAVMWIVGIGLLVKLFRRKNDFIALGFASGLVAFLVGGFFYSYKAEFFWIFAILALAYGSKDLDENVVIKKFKDAKYIFYYIFESDYNFRKTLMVALSLLSVVGLTFYIFRPLSLQEINVFYSPDTNLFVAGYHYILDLMRYSLGNYSFTGRVITVLFMLGTFLVNIGFWAHYVRFYKAIMISAIVTNVIAWFINPVAVNYAYIVVFLVAFAVYTLTTIVFHIYPKKKRKIDYRLLIATLIVASLISHVNLTRQYSETYFNKDLAFLVELAANRSVFNNSVNWIEDEYNYPLVKYYTDHVERSSGLGFMIVPETIRTMDELQSINFAEKNVFITTDLGKFLLEQAITFNEVIHHKDYNILVIEPEALAVLDSQ